VRNFITPCPCNIFDVGISRLCNASLKTRYIGGTKAAQRRLKGVA
jgi:hypothetical protein